MEDPALTSRPAKGRSRFELTPPRRFVLPAVLLFLSERPGYGYSIEKDLRKLRFGRIDRPMVYRALAALEADGLVESWSEAPTAGQARRVYGITPLGEQVLGVWMRVIKEELDGLGRVLRRYRATGTAEAMLVEVEGGWAAALGLDWSPVLATAPTQPPLLAADPDQPLTLIPPDEAHESHHGPGDVEVDVDTATTAQRFRLVPDRSVVMIEVRSTVGPIRFGALGLTGAIEADLVDGAIRPGTQPSAHVEVAVDGLRSGNKVYDAELLRRIDARRFPVATVDLHDCTAVSRGKRYRLAGELTFHGVTRPTEGTVSADLTPESRMIVAGEQVFDIRDFRVPSPTMLMLRIYPDVRVHLHVEADPEEA